MFLYRGNVVPGLVQAWFEQRIGYGGSTGAKQCIFDHFRGSFRGAGGQFRLCGSAWGQRCTRSPLTLLRPSETPLELRRRRCLLAGAGSGSIMGSNATVVSLHVPVYKNRTARNQILKVTRLYCPHGSAVHLHWHCAEWLHENRERQTLSAVAENISDL